VYCFGLSEWQAQSHKEFAGSPTEVIVSAQVIQLSGQLCNT